jgi:hypothetical protein
MIISRRIFYGMRNVLGEVVEKIKTHFMFNKFFRNLAVYEIMSKNIVESEGPQTASKYGAYELHAG